MKKTLFIVLLALIAAAPAMAASLSVTSAAAMGNGAAVNQCSGDSQPGPCGLEVTNDGTTQKAFVRDETPTDETVYRSTFYFDPNDINTAGTAFPVGGAMTLFRARNDAFDGAFQVMMTRTSNRGIRVWVRSLSNNGNPKFTRRMDLGCDDPGCVVAAITLPARIQAEWTQGDTCGAASGTSTITLFDGNDAQVDTSELVDQSNNPVGINNCNRDVDVVELGLVAIFSNTIPNGNSMYFDEFESFRTLAP